MSEQQKEEFYTQLYEQQLDIIKNAVDTMKNIPNLKKQQKLVAKQFSNTLKLIQQLKESQSDEENDSSEEEEEEKQDKIKTKKQKKGPLFKKSTNKNNNEFGNTPAGGLFGNNNNNNNNNNPGGGLFGNNNNNPGGGLFGNNNNNHGGGLFGNNNNNQGGGLFGNFGEQEKKKDYSEYLQKKDHYYPHKTMQDCFVRSVAYNPDNQKNLSVLELRMLHYHKKENQKMKLLANAFQKKNLQSIHNRKYLQEVWQLLTFGKINPELKEQKNEQIEQQKSENVQIGKVFSAQLKLKPQQPVSAFEQFVNEAKTENVFLSNKILEERWDNLPKETKQVYEEGYQAEYKDYLEKMEYYESVYGKQNEENKDKNEENNDNNNN